MTKQTIHLTVALVLIAGCSAGPQEVASLSDLTNNTDVTDSASTLTRVGYEESVTPELIHPPTVVETLGAEAASRLPQRLPPAGG